MSLSYSESDALVRIFGKSSEHGHGTFPPDGYTANLIFASMYVLILIATYFVFFHKKSGFFEFIKRVLFRVTVLGGLCLYFVGYHVYEPGLHTLVKIGLSLFSTARLFILGNDLVEVHNYVNPNFLIWFSVFSVSAAFISTSVLVNLLGKSILTKLKIIFTRSHKNYLFLGLNEAGVALAQDIRKKDPKAFIGFIQNVLPDENASLGQNVKNIHALIVNATSFFNSLNLHHEEFLFHPQENHIEHANHTEILDIKRLALSKKIRKHPTQIFILSDNEDRNIHLSQIFMHEVDRLKITNEINIHIRTTTKNIQEIYGEILSKNTEFVNIHLHNQSHIAATQLVRDHLPVKWIEKNYPENILPDATVNRDFTVAFVGFGVTGNAVFRKLYEQGHFVGSRFKAILIDQKISEYEGEFRQRYGSVVKDLKGDLEFHEMKVNTVKFYDLLRQKASDIDYVIISLGNDDLNIKIAHDLKHFIDKIKTTYKIFVQISDSRSYRKSVFDTDETIEVFGCVNQVYTEDIIIKGAIERIAKNIHRHYNDRVPALKQKEWEELSPFTKNSNISAVEHTITKLTLLGFGSHNAENSMEIVNQLNKFNSLSELTDALGEKRLRNIGKTEHLRWNAFHYINEWSTWKLKEIPADAPENKNEAKKLHACLVNWDELDKISERFGEDYKKYDLDCISDIYHNTKLGLYSNHYNETPK